MAPAVVQKCPRCGAGLSGDLQRIPRRWIDRIFSLIWLRHRYRCHSEGCAWVGNLTAKR